MTEREDLLVADVIAWRQWLEQHHADSSGVWLVLAKKGSAGPTLLTYDLALEEALCFGWVDGQLGSRDLTTFRRRFTPRRAGSSWSQRNVGSVERLISEGRMRPAGLAAVNRARADGTWAAAYLGSAAIEIPDDLARALSGNPQAQKAFAALDRTNRYAVLYRVTTARRPETRAQRIATMVAMLADGKVLHPRQNR